MKVVVAEQGGEGLFRGDVFPAYADVWLCHRLAVRSQLAVANLGIELVVDAGLAREVADGIGERHIIHHNQGNDAAALEFAGSRRNGVSGGGSAGSGSRRRTS